MFTQEYTAGEKFRIARAPNYYKRADLYELYHIWNPTYQKRIAIGTLAEVEALAQKEAERHGNKIIYTGEIGT